MNCPNKITINIIAAAVFIIAAAAGLCSGAQTPTAAFPIYYYSSEKDSTSTAIQFSALYPFIEYRSDGVESSMFALRPLFSKEKTGRLSEFDFVYPIFNRSKSVNDENNSLTKTRLFPIIYKKKSVINGKQFDSFSLLPLIFYASQGNGKLSLIALPFIFYANKSNVLLPLYLPSEQNFFAVFPIYGNFKKFLGRDKTMFILFPLFVFSQKEPGMKCASLIWPVFGAFYGEKIGGFRLWPLFAYTKKEIEDGKKASKAYYLWPLGHHIRAPQTSKNKSPMSLDMLLPLFIHYKRGAMSLEYYFPFWGRKKAPDYVTNSYLFPLLMRTKDTKNNFRQTRLLGILYNRKKGEKNNDFNLFNVYGQKEKPGQKKSYVLWPIFTHNENVKGDGVYIRTYLFPFFSNKKTEYTNGSVAKSYFLLPFFGGWESKEGDSFKRYLWLWWYSNNKNIERNWAPFWNFYETLHQKNGDFKKSVFGKLYVSEKKDGVEQKEFNFLIYSYKKTGKISTHKFFGIISF